MTDALEITPSESADLARLEIGGVRVYWPVGAAVRCFCALP